MAVAEFFCLEDSGIAIVGLSAGQASASPRPARRIVAPQSLQIVAASIADRPAV
ncbi:hypothetical protein [Rhodocyclus tenuis]|uniref:Uncharacterized protein n=1 Tax=Rhodocyclus tenuis TaxID=1066 RepID=A0A840GCS9_RHOTE|nr:hypothetical protein [Rhodocyclus tenuis]MBB4246049.1 hypothetical protein [Rhodocyclus tenuis]